MFVKVLVYKSKLLRQLYFVLDIMMVIDPSFTLVPRIRFFGIYLKHTVVVKQSRSVNVELGSGFDIVSKSENNYD